MARTASSTSEVGQLLGTTHPDEIPIDGVYMVDLYESLLKSVNKKGNPENYQMNWSVLNAIITRYYVSEECIKNLSDTHKDAREILFRPYFTNVFIQEGLEDV